MKKTLYPLLERVSLLITLTNADFADAANMKGRKVVVLFNGFSGSSQGSSSDTTGLHTLNNWLQGKFTGDPHNPFSSQVFEHFEPR
ncbi:MAG: hypothetical protein F6K56_06535 [Moorea sp. SIO3G5]|nr:hypothetical protein [Moorena sp. SIO3G5]